MSQQKYDISLGANYDLFDDTMSSTLGVGTASSSIWGVAGGSGAGDTITWNSTNTVWSTPGRSELENDVKELKDTIQNIEKRLAILHPNKELENSWEELKALGERYRELEKDILEKEKIWDILKK